MSIRSKERRAKKRKITRWAKRKEMRDKFHRTVVSTGWPPK